MFEILDNIKEDFEKFTGISKDRIKDVKDCIRANEEKRKEYGTSAGEYERFLRETDGYIRELSAWHKDNIYSFKSKALGILRNPQKGVLLDFGAGIGTRAATYALAGWEVYLVELNKQCLDFAKWRFNKYGLEGVFEEKTLSEWKNKFDRVLMVDVVGHLPYPQETIDELSASTKIGCGLIIDWDDWFHSDRKVVHRNEEFNFKKALSDIGFVETSPCYLERVNDSVTDSPMKFSDKLIDDVLRDVRLHGLFIKHEGDVAGYSINAFANEPNLFYYLLEEDLIELGEEERDMNYYDISEKGLERVGETKIIQIRGGPKTQLIDDGIDNRILENLVEDFEEFTGVPISSSDNKNDYIIAVGKEREKYSKDNEGYQEFLENSEGLIYEHTLCDIELQGFFRSQAKIKKIESNGILIHYGAGIGTTAASYALGGWDVYLVEPNKTCREFAEWRFKKYGLEGNFYDDIQLPEWEDGADEIIFAAGRIASPKKVLDKLEKCATIKCKLLIAWNNWYHTNQGLVHRNEEFNFKGTLRDLGFVENENKEWIKEGGENEDSNITDELIDKALSVISSSFIVEHDNDLLVYDVDVLNNNPDLFFYLLNEGYIELNIEESNKNTYRITEKGKKRVGDDVVEVEYKKSVTEEEERLLGRFNFLLITLDSCRYDSYVEANTPNMDSYCKPHLVYSPGWFTQPAHAAIFKGHLPFNPKDKGYYNKFENRLFVLKGGRRLGTPFSDKGLEFPADRYPTIASAFQGRGYHTIGIGGVTWFDPRYATTASLREGFEDFHYDEGKCSHRINKSFENQIEALQEILEKDERKKFIFINSPITHLPYQYAVAILGMDEKDRMSQVKCVERFDELFPKLIEILPRPLFCVITSDHGDCFGEWDLWGHGAYHPVLLEVPLLVFEIE